MNIALIGATGFIGSAIREELLHRGHQVTAFASRPEKLANTNQLTSQKIDVQDQAQLIQQLAGHDAIITAFSGHAQADTLGYYVSGIVNIIQASKAIKTPRLLVVGGAGSLEVAPGLQVIDTPDFPAAYLASAEGARQALNLLRKEEELNWTMLSPAAMIAPGKRTGNYRLGLNQLLVDANGNSHISVEDYAMAMVNELEQPQHPQQRFTLAY